MRTTTLLGAALVALTSSTAFASPEIAVGEVFIFGDANVTVAGLPDGTKIFWGAGFNGLQENGGPCFPQTGGDCLDLAPPVYLFGMGTVANGYVKVSNTPPADIATLAPNGVEFQALAILPNGTWAIGPTVNKSVGPTFCPFILAPVCGYDEMVYDNDCIAGAQGMVIDPNLAFDGNTWTCVPLPN